jgi:hypothetical protein
MTTDSVYITRETSEVFRVYVWNGERWSSVFVTRDQLGQLGQRIDETLGQRPDCVDADRTRLRFAVTLILAASILAYAAFAFFNG